MDIHQAKFLVEQHFQMSIHSIRELDSGWQNRFFLINDELVFRFPKQESGVFLMEKEIKTVPYIRQHIHFPISAPIWIGSHSSCYASCYAGYPQIKGKRFIRHT